MKIIGKITLALAIAALTIPLLAATAKSGHVSDLFERALRDVTANRVKARIQFLADDLLEGRGTGARGSEIAARYIRGEFKEDGLEPAGTHGSFFQRFDMLGVSAAPDASLTLVTPKGNIELKNGDNAVLSSQVQKEDVNVDAPLLFVGYGIDAPEFNWNDYQGVDVGGKMLVCLVNQPPSNDRKFFGGPAQTLLYYGRWTYKYEEAGRRHAAGVILIHTNEMAGYPWHVVASSWSGEQAQLPLEAGDTPLPVAAWMTKEAAEKLFSNNGMDLEKMIKAAGERGFKPVALSGSQAQGTLNFHVRRYSTENVAGILPGSDPARKKTCVVVSAHFDHLGIGTPDSTGDRIYHGAVDNASGVAAMLEIARAAADTGWRPKRSILFLAVTAEEQGLLGSLYFARHPTVPARDIAADLNMDTTSVSGEMENFTLLGLERTTLGPLAERVAREMHIRLDPDEFPKQGMYFRSDHFSFARVGVPALNVDHGWHFRGHDEAWGKEKFLDYNEHHYHQPSDIYHADWDLSGTAQECRLLMRLIEGISNSAAMPAFKKGMGFSRAISQSSW